MTNSNIDPWIKKLIGHDRYYIESLIGSGGMGRVYKAVDREISTEDKIAYVAIKFLSLDLQFNRHARNRFEREMKVCMLLHNEQIVAVKDYGTEPCNSEQGKIEIPFMVMELIEAPTLSYVMAMEGLFSPLKTVTIGKQIAGALQVIHAGVHYEGHPVRFVHRDLKPGNIFIVKDLLEQLYVKIADFGIVKFIGNLSEIDLPTLTKTGQLLGTPQYMSPEQATGDKILDYRSDIYSLGCVMYEMLTGKNPYGISLKSNLTEWIEAVVHAPTIPIPYHQVLPSLDETIKKCLEKNPANRFASASDLYKTLSRIGKQISRNSVPSLQIRNQETTEPYQIPNELRTTQIIETDPIIGRRIGNDRYEVFAFLGAGGMGRVYEVLDRELSTDFVPVYRAVKFLAINLQGNIEAHARFEREIQVCSHLQNSNIVRVYDHGSTILETEEGVKEIPFIVMELIQSFSLDVIMDIEVKLSTNRVINLGIQIAKALDVLHNGVSIANKKIQIVHRDLKPGNIFVIEDDLGMEQIKLADFGLAKFLGDLSELEVQSLTTTGQVIGTKDYMSPEQARGDKEIDHRTDIYSLGCLMYEMLTGKNPYGLETNTNIAEWVETIVSKPIQPMPRELNIPTRLEKIIKCCLQKKMEDRFSSALELQTALEKLYVTDEFDLFNSQTEGITKNTPKFNQSAVIILTVIFLLIGFTVFIYSTHFNPVERKDNIESPSRH